MKICKMSIMFSKTIYQSSQKTKIEISFKEYTLDYLQDKFVLLSKYKFNKKHILLDSYMDEFSINDLSKKLKFKNIDLQELIQSLPYLQQINTEKNLASKCVENFNIEINSKISDRCTIINLILKIIDKHNSRKIKSLMNRPDQVFLINEIILEFVDAESGVKFEENNSLCNYLNEDNAIKILDSLNQIINVLKHYVKTYFFVFSYFQSIQCSSRKNLLTIKLLYDDFTYRYPSMIHFSIQKFYKAMKIFGFQYVSIRYQKIYKHKLSAGTMKQYLQMLYHFIKNKNQYKLIYVDKSSLCPNNFQKKMWSVGSKTSLIPSTIKYERIMMLGGISVDGLEGLIFLESNINNVVFNHFILKLLKKQISDIKSKKQVLVYLDNATCHRNKELKEFLKIQKIGIVYGIPGMPELNPIEYFWEFMKRSLRQKTNYEG